MVHLHSWDHIILFSNLKTALDFRKKLIWCKELTISWTSWTHKCHNITTSIAIGTDNIYHDIVKCNITILYHQNPSQPKKGMNMVKDKRKGCVDSKCILKSTKLASIVLLISIVLQDGSSNVWIIVLKLLR